MEPVHCKCFDNYLIELLETPKPIFKVDNITFQLHVISVNIEGKDVRMENEEKVNISKKFSFQTHNWRRSGELFNK